MILDQESSGLALELLASPNLYRKEMLWACARALFDSREEIAKWVQSNSIMPMMPVKNCWRG